MTNHRDHSRDFATVEMTRLVREVQRQALEHLAHQYHSYDGRSAQTMGDGTPRAAGELTTLERHALARMEISATIDQIHDDMNALPIMLASYLAFARKAQGFRAPTAEDAPRCSPNGRDGYMEWMDPLCQDLATKSGLCGRCYMREYRWRSTHGLTPRDVQEGAA
jgi:hypothetical protein